MTTHVSIPILRARAPYIERKDVHVQIRTGVVVALAAMTVCIGLAVAWTVVPVAASATKEAAVSVMTYKPTTEGWQYPRATRSFDSMYARDAETRSVDSMYAKPRSRRYQR